MLALAAFAAAKEADPAPIAQQNSLPRITGVDIDGYYPLLNKIGTIWADEGKMTVQGTTGEQYPKGLWLGCSIFLQNGIILDLPPKPVMGHFSEFFDLEVQEAHEIGSGNRIHHVTASLWEKKVACPPENRSWRCNTIGYFMENSIRTGISATWAHEDNQIHIEISNIDEKVPIKKIVPLLRLPMTEVYAARDRIWNIGLHQTDAQEATFVPHH